MTSVRAAWGSSKWCICRTCLQLIFQDSSVRLGSKTSCWKHKPPDSTGNSSVTVERSWHLTPVSLKTRVNALLGPSISYKKNLSKLIGFRQKSCHSSHCQSFLFRASHRRQRSKSVRGNPVSRTLEKDSTFHWLLVSESPVKTTLRKIQDDEQKIKCFLPKFPKLISLVSTRISRAFTCCRSSTPAKIFCKDKQKYMCTLMQWTRCHSSKRI